MGSLRILLLTEDSGSQAPRVMQQLSRAALGMAQVGLDTRLLNFAHLAERSPAALAVRANAWKGRHRGLPSLIAEIASRLRQDASFVIFHVDTDSRWGERSRSENRLKFEATIRAGVRKVLTGHAPNPYGPQATPLSEADAASLTASLFVMHPCWCMESWLYQATDAVETLCALKHQSPDHQELIAAWRHDRQLLDDVPRPKDEALPCVADRHNEALAAAFPAQDVHAAGRSWREFVDQLSSNSRLRTLLRG
jgi:hypothetical protein